MKRKAKIAGKIRTRGAAAAAASVRAPAEAAAEREFREWIRRYGPVERAIYAERGRREASRHRRARERLRAFGDLCEATEGLAAFAERSGITLEEARRRLRRMRPFHPALALPCLLLEDAWTGLAAMRRLLTRRIDRAKHEARRPAYYAQERARRQALAAERRKVRMRHTLGPCPTRLEILDAWTKVKGSPEALLRFGSLMEDLECYGVQGGGEADAAGAGHPRPAAPLRGAFAERRISRLRCGRNPWSRERGTGNGEWGTGNGKWGRRWDAR